MSGEHEQGAAGEPAPSYSIQTVDGADDGGGTLYVLRDAAGTIVASAGWPHPLEQLAADAGYPLRQLPTIFEHVTDCDVPRRRRRRRRRVT